MKEYINAYEQSKEDFNAAITADNFEQLTDALTNYRARYAELVKVTSGTKPKQELQFADTITGAGATGLADDTTEYTTTIRVGQSPTDVTQVTVVGQDAQTFTELIAEIEEDLTDVSLSISGNKLVIEYDNPSSTVYVSVADVEEDNLWAAVDGYVENLVPSRGYAARTSSDDTVTAYLADLATEKAAYEQLYVDNTPEE